MKKRLRKKLHKRYIEDVVIEISQSSIWRRKIFDSNYDEEILITHQKPSYIPKHLKQEFIKYKLNYYVSKAISCPEYFDRNLVIFKFQAVEFSKIVRYSGNNGCVI